MSGLGNTELERATGTADGQLAVKWSALHDAAQAVAGLAGGSGGPMSVAARNLPAALRDADPALRRRIAQGVDDLAAMMEPGISALIIARARGADPQAAARVLLREFVLARDAVVALVRAELDLRRVP